MSDLFGDIGGIATALGVTKPGWFSQPDTHLKTMLSDPEQRAALIEVIDTLLGGEDATAEGDRTLMPIADIGVVKVFGTLTERAELLDIGLLVRVRLAGSATEVGGRLDLEVPLFAASGEPPSGGGPESTEPLLLGTEHGVIRLDVGIDLPTGAAPGPGGLSLGAAELTLRIPTDGALPDLDLALRGLRMPGAAEPVDVVVAPDSLADLGDSLLQFVMGLVSAQLDGLGGSDPVRALGGLFGLVAADGVPDFPIAQLVAEGPGALARWWGLALSGGSGDAWFAHLRTLLGGTSSTLHGLPAVDVDLTSTVRLRVAVRTAPGAAGLPVVTPVIAIVAAAAAGVELAAEVEPISLDLASGAAVALPSLRVVATIAGEGGPLLPTQSVGGLSIGVGSITAGFALTADRTPQFVLAARNAVVGTTPYDVLDLSNGDALAAAGGTVLGDAAEVLLDQLGDVGGVLGRLVGLDGGTTPQIDPVRLLSDPIGAIRDRWLELFDETPVIVRGVLEQLRDAFASDAGRALPVEGTGTPKDPYRLMLVPGLVLELVRVGTRIAVALSAHVDQELQPSIDFAFDARVALLRADLDPSHPSASVLGDLAAAVSVVPSGASPIELGDEQVSVRTRGLGARVRWRPGADPAVTPWLREAELRIGSVTVDLDTLHAAGVLAGGATPLAEVAEQAVADAAMDAAHVLAEQAVDAAAAWGDAASVALATAVEHLGAGILTAAGSDALVALRDLVAWGDAGGGGAPGGETLSIAALVADPATELRRWCAAAFGIDPAAGEVTDPDRLIGAVARVGRLVGLDIPDAAGLADDPLRFVLPGIELLAGVAGEDAQRLVSRVTGILNGWTPGDALPSSTELLEGLAVDAGIDNVLADLLAGRSLGPDMIEGLVARWADTDGVVAVATAALPTGLDLTRIDGLVHGMPLDGAGVRDAVASVLGSAPARLVLVGVEAEGEPTLLPARGDAAIELDVDLTAAGAPAASFPLPGVAPVGITVVRLAGKGASSVQGAVVTADSGFDAQVARLAPALAALSSGGDPVVIVAGGAAGRVAVAAAAGSDVASVVTVGTPWSPLALGDLDSGPASQGLRLLASLADLGDDGEPLDAVADAAVRRGRDLVAALLGRDVRGDPLTELSAPVRALPAGLDVRAIVGRIDADAVREAITALVRRALDVRSAVRAVPATAEAALSRLGVRIPLAWGDQPGGLRAKLDTDLDLAAFASAALAGGDIPRRIAPRLRLWADGRWLIGGPDPGRAPGPRPFGLRAVTLEAEIPLPAVGGSGAAAPRGNGRLILHDAFVFGVRRARWVIDLSDTGALLPEARALLGELATALRRAAGEVASSAAGAPGAVADTAARAALDLLRTLGLIGPDGGFDAVTLTTFLSDPGAVLQTALASAPSALAAALRDAVGDTRTDAGATVEVHAGPAVASIDLSARMLTVHTEGAHAEVASADAAAPRISLELSASRGGVSLGLGLGWAGGLEIEATLAGGDELVVSAGLAYDAFGEAISLWPQEAALASGLRIGELALTFARDAALAVATRALRGTLGSGSPERGLVDGLLGAVGLLDRDRLVWPGGLIADPAGWLSDQVGGAADALPQLLDAAASLAGITTTPGRLSLVDGFDLTARTVDGVLRVGVEVDAARFSGAAPGFVLGLTGAALVRADGVVVPEATLTVGTAEGSLDVTLGAQAGGVGDAIGLAVTLRRAGGAAFPLYPGGHGVGSAVDLATTAAVAALPRLLDALASHDSASAPDDALEIAARVVATAGRALGLATAASGITTFDATRFAAFVTAPTAALQAALGAAVGESLGLLRDAAEALFDVGDLFEVTVTGGVLAIEAGPAEARVRLEWETSAGAISIDVACDSIPVLGAIRGGARITPVGVQRVSAVIGPTQIPIGPVMLTPLARFSWTPAATAIEVGLAASDESRVIARLTRTGTAAFVFALVAEIGEIDPDTLLAASGGVLEEAEAVAAALARTMLSLAADVVLSLEEVSDFLDDTTLPMPAPAGTPLRDVIEGVVLIGGRLDLGIIDDLDEPGALLARVGRLAANLAPALPAVPLGGGYGVGILAELADAGRTLLGLRLDVAAETPLGGDDVVVSLVADAAWIDDEDGGPAGIRVPMITVGAADVEIALGIEVRGLGIRLSRVSGPLLDAGLRIESVQLLTYGSIQDTADGVKLGGGVSVALEGLGLALGGAGGGEGSNPIAEGVMPSGGAGEDAPKPAFSPSLSILKKPGVPLAVDVRAGTAPGPWWLTVQREFGPIYLEQVGLDVKTAAGAITSISVLVDGAVSLFGFAAAVDNLSLTYRAPGSPFEPSSWAVDVEGFAISADVGGLTLAGGLRKFEPLEGGTEYLGMLLARFGTYGLTVYGGFGQVGEGADQYLSLFLIGGVNGPIGGVPAFFITGIAGGFGVNRRLMIPPDLNEFPTFPLIRVLDSAATDVDPFAEIAAMRGKFPPERGSFWFAAGLSFNSFVLVDGIVVVAIEFGNGFELSILGLARMALPRPQLTLVSIELALVARVSSREGIILVQAQLTDNSWLLLPSVKLTGGFAFAAWFAGPNKGQFVLTIGGYHPDFVREGYPVVPRLGIEVSIGDFVVIMGKSYFALTSEALMAGVRIEIHAELGPAWAHVVLGADAIIYFDPFWLSVTIYASIDAGITIDVWIGKITLSVHIGARVTLTGPPFHVIATLEIGPAEVTLEIGPSVSVPKPLDWPTFLEKYLEDAGSNTARALSIITGKGTIPPAGGAADGGAASPDGQPDRPFRVVAEFQVTLTSTVPITWYRGAPLKTAQGPVTSSGALALPGILPMAVAPMRKGQVLTCLTLRARARSASGGIDESDPNDYLELPGVTGAHATGDFPIGVWGPLPDEETVPQGDLLKAPNTISIDVEAVIAMTPLPPAIKYRQVRTGRRRVLPLLPSVAALQRTAMQQAAALTSDAVQALRAASGGADDTTIAMGLLADRGGIGHLRAQDWRAALAAPVRLGSLGQNLGLLTPEPAIANVTVSPVAAHQIRPARIRTVMTAPVLHDSVAAAIIGGTSVSAALMSTLAGKAAARSMTAPSVAAVASSLDGAIPTRLIRAGSAARVSGATVLASTPLPAAVFTATAASTASRLADPGSVRTVRGASQELTDRGWTLRDGDVAMLEVPDAARDGRTARPALRVEKGGARIVCFGGGGIVLSDSHYTREQAIIIPAGASGLTVIAGPDAPATAGIAVHGGWHDTSMLPSATAGSLVGVGCVVAAVGVFARTAADVDTSWTTPSAVTADLAPTTTTLRAPAADRAIAAIAVGVTGSGSDGVAVGLENAEPLGAPLVTVDTDGTSVLVFAIRQSGPGVVVVNASVEDGRDVTGVFAASAPLVGVQSDPEVAARWLANAIGARGLAGLDRPVAASGAGTTRIRWRQS
ncbi:DUF6603 domain-containing protein [Microbacterium sp. A93]|uniref:DUF6603 domain-containing protein n=1 Tax=Microbacterium sp. A93 TaxID=3450716 RepID=UPI003F436760